MSSVPGSGLADHPLGSLDGVALVIQKAADPPEKLHVLGTVVTPAAAALQRLDRRKLPFPEAQDVSRHIEIGGDFADGPEGVGCLIQFFLVGPHSAVTTQCRNESVLDLRKKRYGI